MPFSTLSEFEHTGGAEQRERNPRHVARNGGDEVEKKGALRQRRGRPSSLYLKSRYNVEGRREMQRKSDRQIAPN